MNVNITFSRNLNLLIEDNLSTLLISNVGFVDGGIHPEDIHVATLDANSAAGAFFGVYFFNHV